MSTDRRAASGPQPLGGRPGAVYPGTDTASGRLFYEHLAWMRRRRLRPATVRMRERTVALLNGTLTPTSLLDATARDIDRWVDGLDCLAIESVRAYVVSVRQFYGWLHTEGHVQVNPARSLVPPRVPNGLPHPISEPDLELALMTASGQLRAWIVLGAYAGLRAGEIGALRRDDVFDTLDRPLIRVVDGKGGRQRILPASPFVLHELAPFLSKRGRLWCEKSHRPNTIVGRLVSRHLHQLGIGATCHSLRHRFATVTYRSSRDLRMVQDLLGHASPTTTAIYAAWDNSAAGQVVDALPLPGAVPARRPART